MYVGLETFTVAVRRLAELRAEGLARLAISPDGAVVVGIEPDVDDAPTPGGGLFIDIFDALTGVANGASVEEFVRARSEPRPGFGEPEQEGTSRAKYEAVVAAFPPDELQRRTWLRITSKLPVLATVEWEILTKEGDSRSLPMPEGVPREQMRFGQVKLIAQPTTHRTDVQEMMVGLDLDDVNVLLKELERLRTALIGTAEKAPIADNEASAQPDD